MTLLTILALAVILCIPLALARNSNVHNAVIFSAGIVGLFLSISEYGPFLVLASVLIASLFFLVLVVISTRRAPSPTSIITIVATVCVNTLGVVDLGSYLAVVGIIVALYVTRAVIRSVLRHAAPPTMMES